MIEESQGRIDYDESGEGPTIVFVPGSCSTGAAWRPIIGQWNGQWKSRFRCVTTSLLGYGGTAERRTAENNSIYLEAEIVESVIRRAGGRVHLVGHSFGGGVALIVAIRKRVPLDSLTIIDMPAVEVLRAAGESEHYRAFREMTDAYFADYRRGNKEAIARMIDFYGGAGTFAGWPPRVRDYAVETTAVNILDWASAYNFPSLASLLPAIEAPTLVVTGENSHPAVQRANELVSDMIPGARLVTVDGAAHFMIGTHPQELARLIAQHVKPEKAERRDRSISPMMVENIS